MFSQTYQIGGYAPAFAPEQRGKRDGQLAVEDGENFIWNVRGVQSGYGVARVAANLPAIMRHPGIMWVKNQKYFMMGDGVYQEAGGAWSQVFAYDRPVTGPNTNLPYDLEAYPWSYAYVGTRHWFCHPTLDQLVYYDEHDDVWGEYYNDCWNLPMFSITHADNGLIVQLQDVDTWSRFDEGTDFNCETWECGAGAQNHALIRQGQPYGVMPYNTGYLTFTSMGVMVSSPNSAQSLHPDGGRVITGAIRFRHEEATFDDLPLGPTVITHFDEKAVVWLGTAGFHQFTASQGGGFGSVQPYAPEMSRFYKETILPHNFEEGAEIDTFRLQYARDLKWLVVSSKEPQALQYEFAHVHQLQLDKWGIWKAAHLEIGSGRADDEIQLQNTQARHFGALSAAAYTVYDPMRSAANSWIRLSPMRFQAPEEDVQAQMISAVQGIRLGLAGPKYETTRKGQLSSPYLRHEIDEHKPSYFFVLISSSDDSMTTLNDEQTYAQLVNRAHNVANYSCHSTGLAHSLIITALSEDQHFDIRHIEMSYFWAGLK